MMTFLMRMRWAPFLFAIILGAALDNSGGASAQTASQITPPSYRPPLETMVGGGLILPQTEGLATPAGAETLFVHLSGVEVEGGFATLDSATHELEARLTAPRVSGAAIFSAARELEAAYARAGYVLVRVVLPPQKLVDGSRLRLIVINGYIEKIETKDVPEAVRARIAAVIAPLEGRRSLTLAEIERRLLLAGDTPGVILHSALAPGEQPGAAILIVEASYQPMSGLVTLDNTLAQSLGRWNPGLGADLNSVTSLGDLIYLRANGDPNMGPNGFLDPYPRNRALAAGIVLPIGTDGLTFNVEGTNARTEQVPASGFETTDVFERLALRLRYPWVRARSFDFNTEFAFDAQDEKQSVFLTDNGVPLSLDRLRILRLSGDGDWRMAWGGVLSGRVTASFGVDGLGARGVASITPLLPLSRQYADASFQKVEASFAYSQPMIDHLAINLNAHGQFAFDQAMAHSEQIGIATPTGLSTFDNGSLQGDSGLVLRGELASPWNVPVFSDALAAVAAPYGFAAAGELYLQHPTALEPSRLRAASYGLGVRFAGSTQASLSNASLTLEWGRQARSDGVPAGDRFTFVGVFRY